MIPVLESTNGEPTQEMKDRVQQLREDIVAAADDHELCDGLLGIGSRESRPFKDVVYDTKHEIETMEMFKAVTLHRDGYYIGWRAVMIGAELLRLDGLRIVESDNGGKLTVVDVRAARAHRGSSHASLLSLGTLRSGFCATGESRRSVVETKQ